MPRFERDSRSLTDTATLARDMAMVLRRGDILRLEGELGAGKTAFVRALAQALGIDPAPVSSPTYVIVNEYPNPTPRPDLVHLDAYRLTGPADLDDLGWDRILASRAIVAIEWADRIAPALPPGCPLIRFEHTGETRRQITIEAPDDWDDRPGIGGLEARPATTCPVTGKPVAGDNPNWPFFDERARLSDLHGWLTERHIIARPIEERDLEAGLD